MQRKRRKRASFTVGELYQYSFRFWGHHLLFYFSNHGKTSCEVSFFIKTSIKSSRPVLSFCKVRRLENANRAKNSTHEILLGKGEMWRRKFLFWGNFLEEPLQYLQYICVYINAIILAGLCPMHCCFVGICLANADGVMCAIQHSILCGALHGLMNENILFLKYSTEIIPLYNYYCITFHIKL